MIKILDFLFKRQRYSDIFENQEIIDTGTCPRCWKKGFYDDLYIQYIEDQTKSNINTDEFHNKAFIQQFIDEKIPNSHIKNNGNHIFCLNCKKKYIH